MYLYPYNSEWLKEYLKEEQAILSAYSGSIQLHHIGSTAVKGLYSKDCIDILGVVSDLREVKDNVSHLKNIGYEYKGDYGIDGREYFSKNARKAHFHIFQAGNVNIKKHLGFVEIMQSKPDLAIRLNQLKLSLVSKYPFDKDSYQREKIFFYDEIHRML